MEAGVPARLTPAEGRKFGLTVGAAFAVLAGITWWRDNTLAMQIFGGLAGALMLAGLAIPGYLGPVFRTWMKLAHLISKVTTPIFLGLVYFVAIMPIGLIMRALGRNPMRHTPEKGSLWQSRSTARGTMSNQF